MAIILLLIISACDRTSQEPKNESINQVRIATSLIAQTSKQELDSLYASDTVNVIDYRVARYVASAELLAGANITLDVDPYTPWHLTPYPKVVYSYDNRPKYYEFGYVIGNEVVATVTTYAMKEADAVIAYLFSTPLDYGCPDLDFYVGNYPERYYGMNGICYLKNCTEELDSIPSACSGADADIFDRLIDIIPPEDKDSMISQVGGAALDQSDIINQGREDFWSAIEKFIDLYLRNILDMDYTNVKDINLTDIMGGQSDDDSEATLIAELTTYLDYAVGYCDQYTIPEYDDPKLQVTHWEGYCGPAACAWIYRGLSNSYNGVYLPVYGDPDKTGFRSDLSKNMLII